MKKYKEFIITLSAIVTIVLGVPQIIKLFSQFQEKQTPTGTIETSGRDSSPRNGNLKSDYKKSTQIQNSISQTSTTTTLTHEEAIKELDKHTSWLKEQSEKLQEGKIISADKDALERALPIVSSWYRESTIYSKESLGQLETSHLKATYKSPDAKEIEVSITDTASASVLLQNWKLIFQMNITRDDESGYQKITTVNEMPVIIRYDRKSKMIGLTAIFKDRYLVELRSKGEDNLYLLKKFSFIKLQ